MKSILWRAAKRLSHIEDARCLKVKNIPVQINKLAILLVVTKYR